MKTILLVAIIICCFLQCQCNRNQGQRLVYDNSTYVNPYSKCTTNCSKMVIQNKASNENMSIVINECDYNKDICVFFSFQCNETHFWYLQSNEKTCSKKNHFLFDSDLYSVVNCGYISVFGKNDNKTTVGPEIVPNQFNLSLIQSNNTDISNVNKNCLNHLNNIYNICLELNNVYYECFHNINKDIKCTLINGTNFNNSQCSKISTYDFDDDYYYYNISNYVNSINQTFGVLSCNLELNYQLNSSNFSNNTECLLQTSSNNSSTVWDCKLLSVPFNRTIAPVYTSTQFLQSTNINVTQIINSIQPKSQIIQIINKHKLKLYGIPILIGILLLFCCCFPLCCMMGLLFRKRSGCGCGTRNYNYEQKKSKRKSNIQPAQTQAIQTARNSYSSSQHQHEYEKVTTNVSTIKQENQNNEHCTPDGNWAVYV